MSSIPQVGPRRDHYVIKIQSKEKSVKSNLYIYYALFACSAFPFVLGASLTRRHQPGFGKSSWASLSWDSPSRDWATVRLSPATLACRCILFWNKMVTTGSM